MEKKDKNYQAKKEIKKLFRKYNFSPREELGINSCINNIININEIYETKTKTNTKRNKKVD